MIDNFILQFSCSALFLLKGTQMMSGHDVSVMRCRQITINLFGNDLVTFFRWMQCIDEFVPPLDGSRRSYQQNLG